MLTGTTEWKQLQYKFVVTLSFEHENPNIDSALKKIRLIFIDDPEVETMIEYKQQNTQTVKKLLSCYHVEEEALDEYDPRNIQITKMEGEREVEGPYLESEVFVVGQLRGGGESVVTMVKQFCLF
jgi:hypothetical protein